jgi:hypothetical protein
MSAHDLQNKHGCVIVKAHSLKTGTNIHGEVIAVKRCIQKTNAATKWIIEHQGRNLVDFVEETMHTIDINSASGAGDNWFNKRALNTVADSTSCVCAGYTSTSTDLPSKDVIAQYSMPFDESLFILYNDAQHRYCTLNLNSGAKWTSLDVAQLLLAHALDTAQPTQDVLRCEAACLLQNKSYDNELYNARAFTQEDVHLREKLVHENITNHQKHTMLLCSNRAEDMFHVSLTAQQCEERATSCEDVHAAWSAVHNANLVQQETDIVDELHHCITLDNKLNIQGLDVIASAHVQIGDVWQSFLPSVLQNQHEFALHAPVRLCHKLEPEDVDLKQLYVPITRQVLVEGTCDACHYSHDTAQYTASDTSDTSDPFEEAARSIATQYTREPASIDDKHRKPHIIGSSFADILCGNEYIALSVHCDSSQ